MKGWLFFLGLFLLGAVLFAAGLVTDMFSLTMADHTSDRAPWSRVLELSGLLLVFVAIYGAAGWRFSKWLKTRNDPPGDQR